MVSGAYKIGTLVSTLEAPACLAYFARLLAYLLNCLNFCASHLALCIPSNPNKFTNKLRCCLTLSFKFNADVIDAEADAELTVVAYKQVKQELKQN